MTGNMRQVLSPQGLRRFGRRWRGRWGKARAFTLADWTACAESVLTLVTVHGALTMYIPLPRLVIWARRSARLQRTATTSVTQECVERLAWMVNAVAVILHMKCLARSLALVRMLSRRGLATDLRIGVRTEDGKLLAHAWIEWQGRVLNDVHADLEPFARFDRAIGSHEAALDLGRDTLHV